MPEMKAIVYATNIQPFSVSMKTVSGCIMRGHRPGLNMKQVASLGALAKALNARVAGWSRVSWRMPLGIMARHIALTSPDEVAGLLMFGILMATELRRLA